MSALLDLIGAVIVGGLLILMVLSVNSHVSTFSLQNGMEASAQENITELASELEFDLRKVGYHVSGIAILLSDSLAITFQADIDNNGSVDTVRYFLGSPSALTGTQNPNDRQLIRQVGSQQIRNSLGLTNFRLKYYDTNGAITWTPGSVRSIEFSLQVEGAFAVENIYSQTTWKGHVFPKNI